MIIKKVLMIMSVVIMFTGYSSEMNSKADGNVTEIEVKEMEKAWCEYNKGKYYAKEQCENIK